MSGPQEGTPNGVDRLADIEEKAFLWMKHERMMVTVTREFAQDVLALVEIAKAARELMDSYGDPTDEAYGLGGTFTAGGDYVSKARCKTLRSALTRLDRPSDEGGVK